MTETSDTPSEFDYDVFVSYSSKDRAWVRGELLDRLEAADLRVCIDYRDFRRGAPGVKEMARAVKSSRKTLLILTPAYLASAWTEFEVLMLQTLDPANRELRLIPLRKEQCGDVPLEISYLTYVDFVEPEGGEDFAWRQLLTALGKPPRDVTPPPETPEEWFLPHPYAMGPNFTGRMRERRMLTDWLAGEADPLLVIDALGGFGKSALAWHWLTHDVDAGRRPRVVFWSFYEGDNDFEGFVRDTLDYLGADLGQLEGPHNRADELLRRLHTADTLIVLDGFERVLRAYGTMMAAYLDDGMPVDEGAQTDCVSLVAEHFLRSLCALPGIRGKVLMTTRLLPSALMRQGSLIAGCRREVLTQMDPADAVPLFVALGIRGTRAEIEAACEQYGYHPLSLNLLAGVIVRDLRQPGDIAAAGRLDVSGDLKQRKHHVLQVAYDSLTPKRQRLLSRIACFRGPVEYDALPAVAQAAAEGDAPPADAGELDADLLDLIDRGLLHRDRTTNRFDLHPIVRRYAYDRVTDDDRSAAHERLRDYFAAVEEPKKIETLDDLAPVIELYHHTVRAGRYDEARELFRDRISRPAYYQFGAYQLCIELLRGLFPEGEDERPRLNDERAQSWTLDVLGSSYSLSGSPSRAVRLYEVGISILESLSDETNLAAALSNLADDQLKTGSLGSAEANLRKAITVAREVGDEIQEAIEQHELGWVLLYHGRWNDAEEELAAAIRLFEKRDVVQAQSVAAATRAHRALLMARSSPETKEKGALLDSALAAARRALEFADEHARTDAPTPRDYVRACWLLGAAHRAKGELADADRHLTDALTRCRTINLVEFEADILIDLARLRRDQRDRNAALDRATEALHITERCEYVLQGADANLILAQLALDVGDRGTARTHATTARKLATCDGPPDHTYKVAYDEAGAMLEELGDEPPDESPD